MNKSLDLHRDDSLLTISLCLSDASEFEGAKLVFVGAEACRYNGFKAAPAVGGFTEFTVHHKKGYGVIHLGSHPHYVTPITNGERWTIALWYRHPVGQLTADKATTQGRVVSTSVVVPSGEESQAEGAGGSGSSSTADTQAGR
jgi:hypothetical protein